MFEQHPVPQQISSYQFRLVGDMTLKQFFQLAGGAIVGLIIYSLPLPGFFKWPLIVITVVAGAAFAFLPFQNRPLEKWIIAFFRSIYAPTIFVWKKTEETQNFFAPEDQPTTTEQNLTNIEDAIDKAPQDVSTHTMEQNEENFLSKISVMLNQKHETQILSKMPVSTLPQESKIQTLVLPSQAEVSVQQKEITIPEQKQIKVKPQGFQMPFSNNQTVLASPIGQVFSASSTNDNFQFAQFSPEVAPPAPPTLPNIIVGQVLDASKKIVEGAILEIADLEGRPVRALKTNKVGHFMIVTPLPDGDYKITTEKEGLNFEPVFVKLNNTLVLPIAIKSKDTQQTPQESERRAEWSPQ